jgi:hypothetical protein
VAAVGVSLKPTWAHMPVHPRLRCLHFADAIAVRHQPGFRDGTVMVAVPLLCWEGRAGWFGIVPLKAWLDAYKGMVSTWSPQGIRVPVPYDGAVIVPLLGALRRFDDLTSAGDLPEAGGLYVIRP